ncbi:hypothetical protein TBK1r_05730 [Stieleria magnilauensis]|uniref:Uncharacterized protein n=1 Tax=Stieleria magnilauensis TaxID=2527963 RepID=A0ABX5XP32_9BACT|nr:hypothetical protein TBK1r_05730 [Planctomycetes bacterium TBK1r]
MQAMQSIHVPEISSDNAHVGFAVRARAVASERKRFVGGARTMSTPPGCQITPTTQSANAPIWRQPLRIDWK